MTTITVANRAALDKALASAKGGETIVLQDGHYGRMKITADYASTVTIRAEDPLDATISELWLWGASNLRFEGVKFNSGTNGGKGRGVISIESGSQNIQIVNSEVTGSIDRVYAGHYGVYVRNSNNITVQNNKIHDADSGIVVFTGNNVNIVGNDFDYFGRDIMKFSGLTNSSVTGNKSAGHMYPIGGVHNDFMQFQGSSKNVVISDNVYLPSTIGHVQGIFANAGYYQNFTIEGNIIYTGMIRGISIEQGSGIKISNNTLLNTPGITHIDTKIFAPAGSNVNNNISSSGAGGIYGNNVYLQNTDPGVAYYVNSIFKNGAAGLGVKIQDLTPVAGSLAETKGAVATLKALLGGIALAPSPTPAPSGDAGGSGTVVINAGGAASGAFKADGGFSGGSTYKTTAAIAGTDADAIYQSERYGNFGYDVAVKNGTYDVTLKFAEIYHGAAGKRVFDVRAENQLVLDNYDIFRMAGGKNKAIDKTFTVKVSDGRLDLDFASVVDKAKVSGIVIAPASTSVTTSAPATAGDAGTVVINAGGAASGAFKADGGFSGGSTYKTTAAIAGTDADAIYQSERYGNFGYDVAVKNGTYDVTLKFAEIYHGAAGKRVFDVRAENQLVLDNYDIFREAGGKNRAIDETFTVKVSDGRLDLDFASVVDLAKVAGIVITPDDSLL